MQGAGGHRKGIQVSGSLQLGTGVCTQGFPQSSHMRVTSPTCHAGKGQHGTSDPELGASEAEPCCFPMSHRTLLSPLGWSVMVSVPHRSRAVSPSPASSPPRMSVSGQTGRWRRTMWMGGRQSTTLASRGVMAHVPGTAAWHPPSRSFLTLRTPKAKRAHSSSQ